jgi:hypothetical protein
MEITWLINLYNYVKWVFLDDKRNLALLKEKGENLEKTVESLVKSALNSLGTSFLGSGQLNISHTHSILLSWLWQVQYLIVPYGITYDEVSKKRRR